MSEPAAAVAGAGAAQRPAATAAGERGRRAGRRRDRWRVVAWAAGGVLAALALAAGLLALAYPGMAAAGWRQARHARLDEMRADAAFWWYSGTLYGRLAPDPEDGLWRLPVRRGLAAFDAGFEALHRGDFAGAIAALEDDVARRGEDRRNLFWLALAHQRQAEAENCLAALVGGGAAHPPGAHRPAAVCTLPLAATHARPAHAAAALDLYLRLLDRHRPDDPLVRWLAHFTARTIGRGSAVIPRRQRIATPFLDRFEGEGRRRAAARHADLRFVDRAAELGVAVLDAGKGVAVEDFDGDGDLDLVTGGTYDPLRYFENAGGRFVERSAEAGFSAVVQPFTITGADYDGDGRVDLFVSRPFHGSTLLRNLGGGRFADVTRQVGLAVPEGHVEFTSGSAWGDYDLDGDLDLFVARYGARVPFARGLLARRPLPSRLLRNDGGRFVDASRQAGLAGLLAEGVFAAAAFGDFDGDSWPDLYLSSVARGASVLLANRGGRFVATDLVANPDPGFTAAFVDVDHDGRLDLFQGAQGPAAEAVENAVFGERPDRYANVVHRQTADGFERAGALFAGGSPVASMGASYGDLDNDGCLDFYLGTGSPEAWFVLPNLMYRGERDGTRCTGRMDDVSMLQGFGTVQKGHGIVFFDFDGDGDQDVYSSLGGMWPGDRWPNQLFVNESEEVGSWVAIRLRGRRTNRAGVGARLRVVARNAAGEEIVRHAVVDQRTGFGSAPFVAHVGLLDAVEIVGVDVAWPASRTVKRYPAELGRRVVLDEAAGERVAPFVVSGLAAPAAPRLPHGSRP
ncbi:MAG TPA: VCBS repeat-containing protein [Thermoanaerobaculia bacterium]